MVRACFLRIRACMQVTVAIFNENKNYKLLINGTKPCNATVCAYNRYTVYLSGPPRGTALITDGFSVFFAPKTYRHKQPMLPWQSFWASVAAIVIFILTCPLVDKIRNRWQDQATFTVISPFARTHTHTHTMFFLFLWDWEGCFRGYKSTRNTSNAQCLSSKPRGSIGLSPSCERRSSHFCVSL